MGPNQRKLKALGQLWANWKQVFSSVPLDDIRDYFGEEIALYAAFLQELKNSLLVPVIVATSFYLMRAIWFANRQFDRTWVNLARVGLSITTTTWCAWFNQHWDFVQELYALRWGSYKLDSAVTKRQERQGYRAALFMKDPVNPDRRIKWYPTYKWRVRRIISESISFLLLGLAIFFVNRDIHEWFFHKLGHNDRIVATLETFCPSFLLEMFSPDELIVSILIYTFDSLYVGVAYRLLDFENHKYHKTYERSLTRKLFLFSAFDYFIPLYHLAFTKMYIQPCWNEDPHEGRCLKSLHEQIRSLLVVSLAGNVMELGFPFIISQVKIYMKSRKIKKTTGTDDLPNHEKDICRDQYDGTMTDYQEVILMYLMLALFTTVFSLLPLTLFIFLLIEMRVDAIKLCQLVRRPFPRSCRNMGAWRGVLTTVSNITIITNICLCSFTTFGKPYPIVKKLLFTLVTTVACFALRELIRWRRPSLQERVELLRRQQTVAEYVAMWGADTDAADRLNLYHVPSPYDKLKGLKEARLQQIELQ
eukprot:Protomagalhaensia_wolfi_Nauph_80__4959@NODE_522_length_2386_cov_6_020452_g388_i0_p1_GENE_NODE_522_length_2386_cov_6_020452_g388_i0NODE_522_length_2386_cov_6_020452_g388_i0_p1_ORF_typecomplete_len532_score69_20Anoctamin/PF04547_12/1_6e72NADH_dh_m_C1/PF15088_6/0_79Ceramidase/PF05875_12/2_1Ceramidase/PF05875_12/1_1e02_NODE_522_length_2386_cov_6_020452_g388_i07652360